MHQRDLLTVHKLEEFAAFCERNNWKRHETKAVHEALRMRRDNEWLLVHKRDHTLAGSPNVVHLTVWGKSLEWAKKFVRETKKH